MRAVYITRHDMATRHHAETSLTPLSARYGMLSRGFAGRAVAFVHSYDMAEEAEERKGDVKESRKARGEQRCDDEKE